MVWLGAPDSSMAWLKIADRLRLLKPYGIEDPDPFVHAVGAQIQTIRVEENSPSVLVSEALDRPGLRKLALRRLGAKPKIENVGNFELMLSTTDTWAAS